MSELVYGLFYLGVLALVVVCLAYLFSTRDQSRASRAGAGESAPRVVVKIILGLLFYPFKVHSYRRTVKNARALICSLGESPLLVQEAEQDAELYRRHFPTVRMLKAEKLTDLLSVLRSEDFNILHLVNAFAEDGSLVESQATRADITPLFQLCRTLGVSKTEKDFEAGGGPAAPVPFLPASLNFLVYVKGNALAAAGQLSLRQLPFIRSMTINANDSNWRRTYQLNTWVSTTEFGYANVGADTVELRFKPVKGHDEMVIAVPSTPLSPGLYRLGQGFIFAVPL
jgi:hypothetical protein